MGKYVKCRQRKHRSRGGGELNVLGKNTYARSFLEEAADVAGNLHLVDHRCALLQE
jgi:hypothetical protein